MLASLRPVCRAQWPAALVRPFASTSAAAVPPPPPTNGGDLIFPHLGIAPQTPATTEPTPAFSPVRDDHTYLAIPPAEDPLLHYLASRLTKHGHRARASRQASRVLLHIHAFSRAPALPIVREAIHAAAPAVRTISTRRGAKQIFRPVALGEKQRIRYALDWILEASKNKNGQTVEERVARELIAVLHGESAALKKKEEVHKFAMVNRYA
jgi:small subunit ribosomal protein S7